MFCMRFINREAAGVRGSSFTQGLILFFSFVGELTETSAWPSAGQDFESRHL